MKKVILSFFLLSLGSSIFAQSKYDPSYSVHNYKHPNKAAEAAKNTSVNSNCISYEEATNSANANYKAQNVDAEQSGAVVATAPTESVNSVFARNNYKSQFGTSKSTSDASHYSNTVVCSEASERHNRLVRKSRNYKGQF